MELSTISAFESLRALSVFAVKLSRRLLVSRQREPSLTPRCRGLRRAPGAPPTSYSLRLRLCD